jgi:hypothetical protein
MPSDQPIYSPHTSANQAIVPTAEELQIFLDMPKKAGRMELHREDLARYVEQIRTVDDFKQSRKEGGLPYSFEEKLYYGVLLHTGFFTSQLRSAMEHFKYYRHALSDIDLKKPVAFIKSAEEEISRLKPNKKDDASKIARLQSMIEERKKDLDARKMRWPALRSELSAIVVSIRERLSEIQHLCEASITTLVDLQVGKKAESQLIEDVKTHFKDQIRDYLQHGPVTKEYVESMKDTVAALSKQISAQLLEDIYSMTGLYEAIHDGVCGILARLGPLIRQIPGKIASNLDGDKEVFAALEQELLSFLSDFRIELKPPQNVAKDMEHEKMLLEKRRDMLDRLFTILTSRQAR